MTKITALTKKYVSWVLCAKFWTGKYCLVKHFAIKIKNGALSNLLFFMMSCWLAHNQPFGMYCYFPVIWLNNFDWSGPDYSSNTASCKAMWIISNKVKWVIHGIDSKYKISLFKAPKDFYRKGNSLGSFHVLNYSCPRQPEINVLGQK